MNKERPLKLVLRNQNVGCVCITPHTMPAMSSCKKFFLLNSLSTWGWTDLKLPVGYGAWPSVQTICRSTPVSVTWYKAGIFSCITFSFHCPTIPGSSQPTETILQISGSRFSIENWLRKRRRNKEYTPR